MPAFAGVTITLKEIPHDDRVKAGVLFQLDRKDKSAEASRALILSARERPVSKPAPKEQPPRKLSGKEDRAGT